MGNRPREHDATFFRDGTWDRPSYWSWTGHPGKVRAGWKKTAVILVAAWCAYGFLTAPGLTERLLAVAGAAGAVLLGVVTWRRWQGWSHHRTRVKPLASALAPVLDQPVAAYRDWVDVPRDYATREGAEVTVYVPHELTGADRELEDVTRAITAKLGWENPDMTPRLGGRKPRLLYRQSQPPPLEVGFADIRRAIEAAKPSQVVLGYGKPVDGKPQVISTDVDSETPHGAASMTTGDGKTKLSQNYAAQLAHRGTFIICLDYKWFSHMWLDGLSNAAYARTPQEIHDILCWLGYDERDADGYIVSECELTRRKRVSLAANRQGIDADVGPRFLIIAEELNATVKVLKRYWRGIGRGPSPALEALDEVGATGRQLKVNVFYIAQRLSARASGADGSADARENIGAIILKDPTDATWRMLAAGHAQPPASGHKGRYQLVTRKEVREFQGTLWTDQEAREYATSGIVAQAPAGMPCTQQPAGVPAGIRREAIGSVEAADLGLVSTVPTALPSGGTVKLADMVAAGLFVSIAAARRRSTRDPLFPAPVGGDRYTGHTYNVNDIYEYLAAKGKQ